LRNSKRGWRSLAAENVASGNSDKPPLPLLHQKCGTILHCSIPASDTGSGGQSGSNLPRRSKTTANRSTSNKTPKVPSHRYLEANTSLWTEALFGAEILILHATPVYYGLGIPRGDGSAVILIPGFLGTDIYLTELHAWLRRIGYRPYFSGIGINAECPNLLIQQRLKQTVDRALAETGRKVHLIGHSLGGVIARSLAGQRPRDVASVITLAAPIRGTVANRAVLTAAEAVRLSILDEHGRGVLPNCYTGHCTCNFLNSLRRKVPASILETAVFTRHDGVVDWHCCMTKDPEVDVEVPGTHIGMAFNPAAFTVVAERLARACSRK
jgi:triacylglycerol lipase